MIILLRQFVLIVLVNSPFKYALIIACYLVLVLSILLLILNTQNGFIKSLVKHLQLIARLLILRTKLSLPAWEHAILHVLTLIWIRPITNHEFSHLQRVLGSQPNVSHLCIFCCVVYVAITPLQRSKLGS